ncbi:response regulator transcription factor [Bacillus sp. BRMEA1]|uniref:response regulator transcription factor n=1 Tax=Neobacillus endophyticus TaxID=2738405 RepID=UPI0015634AD4|nr:response regulator transcription factor [Neobacillus endophyticus]NRD76968.1 response regulator transcription factor [Neobacillus endophyticus]
MTLKAGELCRILIVDDEQLIRKGIIHYLDWEQEGFSIVGEAANGQEALGLIETTRPHIIITDIVMPMMDGEELTRVVKERYPQIEIIILSSFGEFDYVRSTFQHGIVDYILKPKLDAQSLLKGLKSAASRIPSFQTVVREPEEQPSIEHIIHKLISGYEVARNEEWRLKKFPYRYFYLVGVATNHAVELQEAITDGISRHIGKGVQNGFSPNENLLVFLLNLEDPANENLIQFAKSEPGLTFVLTEPFTDFFQLGQVYKESFLKLLDYRFYLSKKNILTIRYLPMLPAVEKFNLDWFTAELKRSRFEPAFDYLKGHSKQLSSFYVMDIFEYKAFFSNMIFTISILLSNMEYDVKELENARYAYLKAFDETSTAQEALALLDAFITEAWKCLEAGHNHQENFNLKKLIHYIMDHYAEPLTLTEVAKQFHFNPSYLSSYFSTHMREGFVEYLNKIRIEQATKLLKEGKVSISEISGMVGYSDHSYFCKVFKKVKGLSPSQYKRKHT